jgi:hypothetical protein
MTDETYITQKLLSYVSEIYENVKVEKYFGVSRSLKILNHVNNCIILEGVKDKKIILALRYASILEGVDNPLFFSSPNSQKIKDVIDDVEIRKKTYEILKYVHHIYDSQPKEQYMLFPRYANMLELLGEVSLVRLYFYYCFYQKPIRVKKLKSIEYYQNMDLFEEEDKFSNSMIEHYCHLLKYKSYLEKCNIPYIINEARERYLFMEKYISNYKLKTFDANEIIKINKKLRKKRLI